MSIDSSHVAASKQNFGDCPPLVTGGSWKKSPVTMTWIPPKGLLGFLRSIWPILHSLSNKSASTMETDRVSTMGEGTC
jgi:hypothetical protein